MSWQSSTDANSAHIHMRKSRGPFTGPLTIVTADVLGRVVFSGFEGTSYNETAYIRALATGTVAATRIPSKLEFWTSTDAAPSVATLALTLDKDQSATFGGTVTIPGLTTTRLLRNVSGVVSNSLLSDDGTNTTLTSGALRGPDGTAALPTYSFSNNTSTGMFSSVVSRLQFAVAGSEVIHIVGSGQIGISSGTSFGWSSAGAGTETLDTTLFRDAAGTLALRSSTTAQSLRVYNTFTDASNYERATFNWASNVLHIGAQNAGTGTARVLQLDYGGTTTAAISIPITSGPITFGGSVVTSLGFVAADTSGFFWNARGRIVANADGVFQLTNNGAGDFSRLQFGSTTSSFPALKKNGANLEVKLADDSAYSRLAANGLNHQGVTIANLPGTPAAGMTAYVTDGDASLAWGATVVNSGAGATKYLVWYNGSNWTVAGK
jgi:hypothetical protein